MKLSYCPTGPGGGVDPSCGKGGPKFQEETTKRVLLAAQASIKAKSEKNFIKAAQLHGKAARANERAAKALQKDPAAYNQHSLIVAHWNKMRDHEKEARDASQKLLGASSGKLQEYKRNAEDLTSVAMKATKEAFGPGFGSNVKFYGSGNAEPLSKTIAYAKASTAHEKAAAAHEAAGNEKAAAYHRTSALQMAKQFEYYRGML